MKVLANLLLPVNQNDANSAFLRNNYVHEDVRGMSVDGQVVPRFLDVRDTTQLPGIACELRR